MREIVLDTETTGLDPHSGHRVVEIGCVELRNHVRTGNVFHTYLNPERDMPPEAERIHGLSIQFLSDKPLFKSVAASFLEFIEDSTLIIHNAQFDMKFINAELEWAGHSPLAPERATDTVLMARRKYPGQPAGLDALCRRFNIDLTAREKHGALLDAELLADVYLEMMGGRQQALILASKRQAEADQQAAAFEIDTSRNGRIIHASEEERAAHEKLIQKISEPIWKKFAG